MGQEVLLQMTDICKEFPGVKALDHVSLTVKKGTVHALMGENGAGKSTLMKCLFGIYSKDAGKIELEGKEVNFKNSREALNNGVAMVHQELNQALKRNVMDNIWLGRYPMTAGIMVNEHKMLEDTNNIFEELGIAVDPKRIMSTMPVSQRQMVEIAKALSFDNTRILIMDEPTAALTQSEIEELFVFIRRLKAKGVGIVYISHRMEELKIICDRVTVMRDGQYVGTHDMADVSIGDIIHMMVGRVIYTEPKTSSGVCADAPIVLEVKNLKSPDVKNVSFKLLKGEILGFAGLMGAGRTETARLICGADPLESGEIYIKGKKVTIRTPYDAVQEGIGYLSEDRKLFGLCLGLSVGDNIALPNLATHKKGIIIDDVKIKKTAEKYIQKIGIKTPGFYTMARSLSGGNQQKVVLAKWLERDCDVLIFDEPTRGIDVGAKSEIYRLMQELVENGKSIIMISSEMPELLRMSDRIVVMCEGRATGELSIAEANQENIMELATKTMEE